MSNKLTPNELRNLRAFVDNNIRSTGVAKPASKEESRQLAIFQRKQEFTKSKKEKGYMSIAILIGIIFAAIANGVYIHAWQTGYDECKKVQTEEDVK